MTYIAVFLVLLFAYFVLRTYWWQYRAAQEGTETDAVVSRIAKTENRANGETYVCYDYYALYRKEDGTETEARLWNPKKELVPGSRIRIRYLPCRDNYAVVTKVL